MALKGIKVIELAGLAPAPHCAMVLGEFGASVIRVDKIDAESTASFRLSHGEKSIALNLKDPKGQKILRDLCKQSDVLIEPFRHGVMERLGLGPEVLLKDNPKLVYARLTGFGQEGLYCTRPGHELNFLALSGLVHLNGFKPLLPSSVPGDFGGGGLTCAFGIVVALLERQSSGLGQIVDCSIAEGAAYLRSSVYRSRQPGMANGPDDQKLMDIAHFYGTYRTKDGKYMAVAAIEPQFYAKYVEGLGFTLDELPQSGDYQKLKQVVTDKFMEKTQKEWCDIFDGVDACVTPMMTLQGAADHPHNIERKVFSKIGNIGVPNPAPKLSRTPAASNIFKPIPAIGEHTKEVLRLVNYDDESILKLTEGGTVKCFNNSRL